MTNCKTCSREKMFDGEGCFILGDWYCCHNCIQKSKEKGNITQEDIYNRRWD